MRALVSLTALLLLAPAGVSFHLYRDTSGGCSAADGALGAAPTPDGATVFMLHNSYLDLGTGLPVTVIGAGESVTWLWSSAHCHSATSGLQGGDGAFDTGFHYPVQAPATPQVLPGLFEYPVPELAPTLAYTAVFETPGVFTYFCVHHAIIGMYGVVLVQ